jgi:hypothetical protein
MTTSITLDLGDPMMDAIDAHGRVERWGDAMQPDPELRPVLVTSPPARSLRAMLPMLLALAAVGSGTVTTASTDPLCGGQETRWVRLGNRTIVTRRCGRG